ncbi:hypothetical protein P5673_019654 [Acropora cervicornis]|uniref:Uncharacterized protein n=1 Tax=Acropora cervicornis TaxID=6130 RepID=A0AAD9V284_ACRCE|nr:hypothetical protein P5673_019654 [Acropora cervicornis]
MFQGADDSEEPIYSGELMRIIPGCPPGICGVKAEDRAFCLSVTATKLSEFSGLRMVEEEVWRLQRHDQCHL